MKQDIALKLADALESGEYVQGTGALCSVKVDGSDKRHCCLGVLSEIAVNEGVVTSVIDTGNLCYGTEEEFDTCGYGSCFPPNSVAEWAGLDTNDNSIVFDVTDHPKLASRQDEFNSGSYYHRYGDRILIPAHELNDHFNFTFAETAQLIRDGKITSYPDDNEV